MRYKLTLEFPTAGDADVYIPGLGHFRNGQSHEISSEQAQEFKGMRGISLGRAFKDTPGYVVEPIRSAASAEKDTSEEDDKSSSDKSESTEDSDKVDDNKTPAKKAAAPKGGER